MAEFDSSKQISVRLNTPDGLKTITVRYPTDEELIERQRKRRIVIKSLGRGKSETSVPDSEEADQNLLNLIRTDQDGIRVDAYEAALILDQVLNVEIDEVESGPGSFLIKLRVPGAMTQLELRMPSAKDIVTFRRAYGRMIDMPFGRQMLTLNSQAAAALYKTLMVKVEGYAGEVPINHKTVAVQAAIEATESGLGVSDSENFQ